MAEIIDIQDKIKQPGSNVISTGPWEFRKAHWETANFVQMLKSQSDILEDRAENMNNGKEKFAGNIPVHYVLLGGMAYTIRAVYISRKEEEKMRRIYYLAGLMDCMINQVNPVLRTDLLRSVYKKIFELQKELNVHWYGPIDQLLLPIDSHLFNESEYRSSLNRAGTLKELYSVIKEGTGEMFDVLSFEYVFYCPRFGG